MITLRIFSVGEIEDLRKLERATRKTVDLQSHGRVYKESNTGRLYSEIPVSLGQIAKSVDEQGHDRLTILIGDDSRENRAFDLILVSRDTTNPSITDKQNKEI